MEKLNTVERAIFDACQAWEVWRATPIEERIEMLGQWVGSMRASREELIDAIVSDAKKPVREAVREVDKVFALFEFYKTQAGTFLAAETHSSSRGERHCLRLPIGLVLTISPANFPLWQMLRSTLPTLIAGNVAINKPAPMTKRVATLVHACAISSTLPRGVFQTLAIPVEDLARWIADPRVRGVAFTGGREAGREVGAAAARSLKPCVLELGGNDPALVFADANFSEALKVCVSNRLYNNGQTCLGPKRILVERTCYDAALSQISDLARESREGSPYCPEADRGPLITSHARARLHRQVLESLEAGARCLVGGRVPEGPGAFYPATVLADVYEDMVPFREEIFGPVISVTPFDDESEALRLANASPFGLGASVFCRGRTKAERLFDRLDATIVGWNTVARSVPELPFGGIKDSGYGHELGKAGLFAFTNLQVRAFIDS